MQTAQHGLLTARTSSVSLFRDLVPVRGLGGFVPAFCGCSDKGTRDHGDGDVDAHKVGQTLSRQEPRTRPVPFPPRSSRPEQCSDWSRTSAPRHAVSVRLP